MMMFERAATSPAGFPSAPAAGQATSTGANCILLPRCKLKVEKCKDGLKLHCECEDEVACGALQNLCNMLAGGLCSVCCTWNGMTMCQCNLCCGNCKCEPTKNGCTISCSSGDKKCCDMLQAYCDCLNTCLASGCCAYVCFGNTPVCCCTC